VPGFVGGGALMCGLAFRSPPARRRRVTLLRQWDGANGTLARTFWRVLDALDYRVMQARLWRVDAGIVRPVAKVSRSPLPAHEVPTRDRFAVDEAGHRGLQ
jgi:hypothetical protein